MKRLLISLAILTLALLGGSFANASTSSVDHIRITVYYTEAPAASTDSTIKVQSATIKVNGGTVKMN